MPSAKPVRVRLPGRSVTFPRLCACCLLSLEELPEQARAADELSTPWCQDCRHHSAMRKVDRALRTVKLGSWSLMVLCIAVSFAVRGLPQLFLRITAASLLLLAGGLTGLSRIHFEDRKETCTAPGIPVRAMPGGDALELECDNPDFASLLVEANPGAGLVASPGLDVR